MAKSKKVTISAPGKKSITFKKGGLHQSLGVKAGEKIPSAKIKGALAGKFGPKALKQAMFMKNVLHR